MKWWSGEAITTLQPDYVFVFGSNPEGRHGLGAAKQAMKFCAKYGQGRGLQGQTYGLVTKNLKAGFVEKFSDGSTKTYPIAGKRSVSLEDIQINIEDLYSCCYDHPELKFFVAYIDSTNNLNGYSSRDIFDMFMNVQPVPSNIHFHNSFKEYYKYLLTQ